MHLYYLKFESGRRLEPAGSDLGRRNTDGLLGHLGGHWHKTCTSSAGGISPNRREYCIEKK